jgi:hypothetical protein
MASPFLVGMKSHEYRRSPPPFDWLLHLLVESGPSNNRLQGTGMLKVRQDFEKGLSLDVLRKRIPAP